MTKEQEPPQGPVATVGEVEVWESDTRTEIYGIPGDSDNRFSMSISATNDMYFTLNDSKNDDPDAFCIFGTMRFRSGVGGGAFPHISAYLVSIMEAFQRHNGQISDEYRKKRHLVLSYGPAHTNAPSNEGLSVVVGKSPNEPRYIIKGLPNENDIDETLDIEISQAGDATITLTDFTYGRPQVGTMTFKTAENGGKYPIMAEAFTKIAEGIAEVTGNKF